MGLQIHVNEKIEIKTLKTFKTHANALEVNFETIKNLVRNKFKAVNEDDDDNQILLNFIAIRRLRPHVIVTRDERKSCPVVLKKRIFLLHL